MESIAAAGNATGVCSVANTTNVDMPELVRDVVGDVLGGLFESTGVKPPAGEDAYSAARSAYSTLYIYYWGSVFIAMLSFAAIFWIMASSRWHGGDGGKKRLDLFEKMALGSRGLIAVVAAALGAGAANHMFIYNFLKSPAILPVVAGLLAAVVLLDRLGRWVVFRQRY